MSLKSNEKDEFDKLRRDVEIISKEYRYTLQKLFERANLYDSCSLELKITKEENLSLNEELQKNKIKNSSFEVALDNKSIEVAMVNDEKKLISKKNLELEKELASKKYEMNKLEMQLVAKSAQVEELGTINSSIRSENSNLKMQCSDKSLKIESLKIQHSSLSEDYKDKVRMYEVNNQNITELKSKLDILDEKCKAMESKNIKLSKENISNKDKISEIESKADEYSTKLKETQTQLSVTTTQLIALQKELSEKKSQTDQLEKNLKKEIKSHNLTFDKLCRESANQSLVVGQLATMTNELELNKASLIEVIPKVKWLREKNKQREEERNHFEKKSLDLNALLEVTRSQKQQDAVKYKAKLHDIEKKLASSNSLCTSYNEQLSSAYADLENLKLKNRTQTHRVESLKRHFDGLVDNIVNNRSEAKKTLLKKLGSSLNPTKRKVAKQAQILSQSPYFNAEWYLKNNLDVALSQFDPVEHFLLQGADEGREPSLEFSCRAYRESNPDVAQSGLNPLLHYLLYGIKEGRKVFSNSENSEYLKY